MSDHGDAAEVLWRLAEMLECKPDCELHGELVVSRTRPVTGAEMRRWAASPYYAAPDHVDREQRIRLVFAVRPEEDES